MKQLLLTFFLLLSFTASGASDLLVFASEAGGTVAGPMCFFSNHLLTVYQNGVIVHYVCLGGSDLYGEVWSVTSRGYRLVARSELGNLLSDAVVFKNNIMVTEFNEGQTTRIFQATETETKIIDVPAEYHGHLKSFYGRGDELTFRFGFDDGSLSEGVYQDGVLTLLPRREGISYYYTAESSDELSVQKIGRERGEEIELRFAPQFKPEVILQTQGLNPASPFKQFYNFLTVQGSFGPFERRR